jgi:ABC-2 type transport system ATP-binding protein
MIILDHVMKSFGRTKAVDDISFTVKDGEIVGFLGPNGAGKTTTMRMMTGFYTPDSGRIEILGTSITADPTKAQFSIGYLPENNPLYKDMLVSEQLSFSADLKGIKGLKRDEAIEFAVRSVSIEDVYHVPIRELSKGYRQRVGIAQTLLHKPKILIMDEPSEGLDPNQRTEIRSLIRNLSKDHTVIMSTHVMQEVEAVCNRMIIINKGKLVADGTPRELLKSAGGKRQLIIELEGKKIEESLLSIKGVEEVETKKGKDGKIVAIVTVAKTSKIQPELSKKSAKLGWTIWKLTEEEKQLEDVFHTLTE